MLDEGELREFPLENHCVCVCVCVFYEVRSLTFRSVKRVGGLKECSNGLKQLLWEMTNGNE